MAENLVKKVGEMKQQGMSDQDIAVALAEEGASPADINDAIGKSQIKAAVNQEPAGEQMPDQYGGMPDQGAMPPEGGMPMQGAGPGPGAYPEYVQGMSSETVSEIAEQIISEKLADLTKSITQIDVFRENTEKRIVNMDERLKKVESVIDELRSAIIRKFGENAENIEAVKNEMGMMQDSFSKVVKPWTEGAKPTQTRAAPVEEPSEEEEEEPAKYVKKAKKNNKSRKSEEEASEEEENLIRKLKPKNK